MGRINIKSDLAKEEEAKRKIEKIFADNRRQFEVIFEASSRVNAVTEVTSRQVEKVLEPRIASNFFEIKFQKFFLFFRS